MKIVIVFVLVLCSIHSVIFGQGVTISTDAALTEWRRIDQPRAGDEISAGYTLGLNVNMSSQYLYGRVRGFYGTVSSKDYGIISQYGPFVHAGVQIPNRGVYGGVGAGYIFSPKLSQESLVWGFSIGSEFVRLSNEHLSFLTEFSYLFYETDFTSTATQGGTFPLHSWSLGAGIAWRFNKSSQ